MLVEQMLAPLRGEGYDILLAASLESAREALRTWSVNCVVLDLTLPDAGGLELIEQIYEIDPDVAVVILSGDDDESRAMAALQRGAAQPMATRDGGAARNRGSMPEGRAGTGESGAASPDRSRTKGVI